MIIVQKYLKCQFCTEGVARLKVDKDKKLYYQCNECLNDFINNKIKLLNNKRT